MTRKLTLAMTGPAATVAEVERYPAFEHDAGFADEVERVGLGSRAAVDVLAVVVLDRQCDTGRAASLDAVVLAIGTSGAVGTVEAHGGGGAAGKTTGCAVLDAQCEFASTHFLVGGAPKSATATLPQVDRPGVPVPGSIGSIGQVLALMLPVKCDLAHAGGLRMPEAPARLAVRPRVSASSDLFMLQILY